MLLLAYRLLVCLLAPALRCHLLARVRSGKEDGARISERYGIATEEAFHTPPIWIHAASVGEAQAALIIIDRIRAHRPEQSILMTTGTVTSAGVMATRLPDGCVHQYAPLDHPRWVNAFLDYWRPCAMLRLESEIWPNMLMEIQRHKIPSALINAHMSARSFKNWRHAPKTFRTIMETFQTILAEGDETLGYLQSLGVPAQRMENLKLISNPLDVHTGHLHELRAMIGARPVWVYASTHQGEEILATDIHTKLAGSLPELLTIIVPRHPNRRDEIAAQIRQHAPDIKLQLRSSGILPGADTGIYVADTMGELGVFYALSPFAVIGRSFSDDGRGGHNPIEAAQLGCFPLSGPHVQNLTAIYNVLEQHQAVEIVPDKAALEARVGYYLKNADVAQENGHAARDTILRLQLQIASELDSFISKFLLEVSP